MLADDLEAELSALEEKAPVFVEADTDEGDFGPGNPKPEADEGKPGAKAKDEPPADEWKPPSREEHENLQKAVRAEREAKREATRQARLYEQNVARIEQQVQAWQQQQIAQRLQQPPPDPYENPQAAREWQAQQQQLQQQLWAAQQQREQQEVAQRQQHVQFQRLNASVEDYETEFKSSAPDYDEASDHVLNTQQALLEASGYPPEVAQQQVAMWSVSIAQQALASGRDPAKMTYEMAQKMGYVPASKRQAAEPAQAAADKLAAIKAGQASAQTLSGGGGGAQGRPSLKTIANLEGAAFDAAMEKYLTDSIRGR